LGAKIAGKANAFRLWTGSRRGSLSRAALENDWFGGRGLPTVAASDPDFLTALGAEFCGVPSPVPGDLIVPHDGYEM
jgi:hypothetical protein